MMAELLGRLEAIDILVNNAVVRHFAPIEAFAPEHWEEALAVNLSAPFHLIRLALPAMKKRGWGRIFNMASIYSTRAVADRIYYVTTKTAILGITWAVAIETTASGITCNALCPGTLPTPAITQKIALIAAASTRTIDETTRDYLAARQPTGPVCRHGSRRRDGCLPVKRRRTGHHGRDAADRWRLVHRMSAIHRTAAENSNG